MAFRPIEQPKLKLAVEIRQKPSKELKNLPRSQRYRVLLAENSRTRDTLISWLKRNNLADEVSGIGKATAFSLLFMEATDSVARQLRDAPNVTHVSVVDSIDVELLAINK